MNLSKALEKELSSYGFKRVKLNDSFYEDCKLILKRQTWNTNRAVCILERESIPDNFDLYIKEMRKAVALKVKFIPLFYGVGIQFVLICPGILRTITEPKDFVSKIDNQWAIVQSLFLIDTDANTFKEGRTWGQVVTGRYQDVISNTISASFESVGS